MNRHELIAGASLAALVAVGLGHKYAELSTLAATPPPSRIFPSEIQLSTRPQRTVDTAITAYLASNDVDPFVDQRARLTELLTTLESVEFNDVNIDSPTAERLAQAVVAVFDTAVDGDAEALELRRRAVGLLAGQIASKTSRDFVLKTLEEGPAEVRLEALRHVGSPHGVRGHSVFTLVKELGERGLVPDTVYPAVLRRTGGIRARGILLALMASTDNAKLIAGCAISLQDYRDPELIGPVLERLEQVGMIESAGKLPWLSAGLLDEHLKSAGKNEMRRAMIAISVRPTLIKRTLSHVEQGLQSPDPDTRRYAAIAVKKAVIAKVVDARQGETLLAGRLQVETEPVLKAELTGGLERIHSLLNQAVTGVQ